MGNVSSLLSGNESNFTIAVISTLISLSGIYFAYEFYIDSVDYWNKTDYNYTNFTLIETNSSYGNLTNFSWSFTPNFTDETYGKLKNLTSSF